MLFDLRGRGRRRVVQVIYVFLALLMGGGLVLFGIGGNTNGGLFDAFKSGNGSSGNSTYTKQIETAQKRVTINPKNAAAWATLASLHLAQGSSEGGFDQNSDGLKEFAKAAAAWDRYTALNPPKADLAVARQMIGLYGPSGLNKPDKAVGAMDLVIAQTSPPDAELFKQYAQLAYVAGQTRKGDLASKKAVALSAPADRKQVKAALASLKAQIVAAAAQQATTSTTGTTTGG